ncbi:hypothetical protein SPSIL_006920 [Sporomusa silvacetica DSM 10669]|uniref:Glycosyl hydrolase family 13 catalytic domain-containing protein n=1 Tax=Sporomusa silvacetica DSM 10669 TaxID=1123289 RepID=A0ABZ3IG33_9FIRM|nr:alpha-amylase family glycosyl hydrolase [Sporomusa silvacetica]OZC16444.1 alpha-amylase precursor [Sporomusa silvacetica DSM 10669]
MNDLKLIMRLQVIFLYIQEYKEFKDILTNVKNPYPSPEDWRDIVIYFIMTDRFNKSGDTGIYNKSLDGKEWDKDEYNGFLGGNFKGITEKLDYLKELGVGAVWITPPFKNCGYEPSFYGYGIQDFLSIDSRFGTEKELQEFVRKAHSVGIYVIFDIVLNHVGNVFKYDLGKQHLLCEIPMAIIYAYSD